MGKVSCSTAGWVPRTMLIRPPPAADVVVAAGLLHRIRRAVATVPLTLVLAQAGAGTTTLAAAAAHDSGVPVGWIRPDDLDDDPAILLELLVLALAPLVPGGCR